MWTHTYHFTLMLGERGNTDSLILIYTANAWRGGNTDYLKLIYTNAGREEKY